MYYSTFKNGCSITKLFASLSWIYIYMVDILVTNQNNKILEDTYTYMPSNVVENIYNGLLITIYN